MYYQHFNRENINNELFISNLKNHPHGIKVRLESGLVGRVKEIVPED